MKKVSLKVKLTLLYTACMVFVIGFIFAVLFSISNREVLASTQMKLKNRVQESMDEVEWEDGQLEVDSDFYQIEDNVYLALYDENAYFLYGKRPSGFTEQIDFSNGEVQKVKDGKREWYVYDLKLQMKENTVYIRGLTSVTDAEESFLITIRIAVILLPLTALLVGILVYRMTRRTLLPVKTITETVQEIRHDADLSRRVGYIKKMEERIGMRLHIWHRHLMRCWRNWRRYSKGKNNLHLMCHMSCEHLSALFWHSVSRVWKKKALTKNSGNRLWSYRKRRGQSQS